MDNEKFVLVSDNDGHWYVIPLLQMPNWSRWCEFDSDDERAWTPPDFAKAVGGSPARVVFEKPEIV